MGWVKKRPGLGDPWAVEKGTLLPLPAGRRSTTIVGQLHVWWLAYALPCGQGPGSVGPIAIVYRGAGGRDIVRCFFVWLHMFGI